ncbi:MAG TPA: S8 family serine peptidase [Bryobacteraceae bacterium]|nr:S8 family serine peptidase [Bryobacteraceae bacterium]
MHEELMDAIRAATEQADASVTAPRARFAMLVRPVDDPLQKRAEIESALAPLGATVRPLSPLETDVLVAAFPDRVFALDDASAFAAAYLLQDVFDLESAEPDLPTNLFPEIDQPASQKDAAREGVAKLCFTEAQRGLDPHWALDAMRVKEAWAFSVASGRPDRGRGVIIAQPDTGVIDHEELRDVTRVDPRDVLDDDNDPTDPLEEFGNPGHGTGTGSVVVSREAGTIAGSAPLARHMPIRAIKSVLRITQVSVAEAVEWAVDHGAHVITMSLGGIPSFALHRAIRRAVAADVIVLAAAGNCVRAVVWPARYEDCLAVAGVNSDDQPWLGTCRGSSVDFSAPAENVYRARVGTPTVGQGQGTSFAVALTAGVAALWLAHHGRPNLIGAARARRETLQAMFRRLVRATARRPRGWDSFNMGAGIVDARALLQAPLDLNRGLESAPQHDSAVARSAIAVQSLALERIGEAAYDADIDWNRHGAEIATLLLRSDGETDMLARFQGGAR